MQGKRENEYLVLKKDYDKLLSEKSNDIIRKNSCLDEGSIEVKFFDYKLGRKNSIFFIL